MGTTNKDSVYNIIAFVFTDKDKALQVSKELKKEAKPAGYKIIANAVVQVDANGKAHVHEAGHGVWGAALGAGGLGLLSLIGGPAGLLIWAVAGGAIGGIVGQHMGRAIPADDLKKLAAKMQPNTSAILAMVENTNAEALIGDMKGYNAQVVTLTVADEVSGEIAEGVAVDVEKQAPASAPAPAATPAKATAAAPAPAAKKDGK